ncbi:hypothetical protein An03g03950 [Aspergillus niger]|uniref:Uncharacterized protein n=2 Tax=Aspergillus niger TaxID=5061 RepID=A2QGN7_ASPNC|nr:hypothetical protein An03g03950 [Aspergillus niger]CAK47834.1 hypothetical protein An03g03950 [Aspergillus niger]
MARISFKGDREGTKTKSEGSSRWLREVEYELLDHPTSTAWNIPVPDNAGRNKPAMDYWLSVAMREECHVFRPPREAPIHRRDSVNAR